MHPIQEDNCQAGQQCDSSFTYDADYFAEGLHSLKVIVNDGSSSAEHVWQITVNNVPAPDFTVVSVWQQFPSGRDPNAGELTLFGARIDNVGETVGTAIYAFDFGDGNTFRSSPIILKSGETATVYMFNTYINSGTYNLIVESDPDNTLAELKEDNNQRNIQVNVR